MALATSHLHPSAKKMNLENHTSPKFAQEIDRVGTVPLLGDNAAKIASRRLLLLINEQPLGASK
jgi:hypothetical protein